MTVRDKNSNKETPDARTLILDMLAARGDPTFDVRSLVRAGALFGLSPQAMRTAIARLKREGRLKSLGRGCYAGGDAPGPWRRRIDGWRDVLARREPWKGDWFMAALRPGAVSRTQWRHTLRALNAEGFRQTSQGPWLRPGNLAGGVEACRDRLTDLGAAPSLLLSRSESLSPPVPFRDLWDIERLENDARRTLGRLRASAAGLEGLAPAQAAWESLIVGRAVVRAIVLDPLLPEAWTPSAVLPELIAAMKAYRRQGVTAWTAYLADERSDP